MADSLRERKKVETRQRLSDVATALFLERGFDQVSVSEVAEAAGVSKMTVFNYFPRKEDLLFDRGPEMTALLTAAVRDRTPGTSPTAALTALVLRLIDERHPFMGLSNDRPVFWNVVLASPALRIRAREAVEAVESTIAGLLAEAGDPDAELNAAVFLAATRIGFVHIGRRVLAGEKPAEIQAECRAYMARVLRHVEPAGGAQTPRTLRVVLNVAAYDEVVAFWTGVLGRPRTGGWDRGPADRGALVEVAPGGVVEIVGHGPDFVTPSYADLAVAVEVGDRAAVDAMAVRLKERGVPASEPAEQSWGHYSLSLRDPAGVEIVVYAGVDQGLR
jgi:AcrR family transcriptional regulator/catechol 2,3-dioxygenase-like lactoylglutathione lyase family enzyme